MAQRIITDEDLTGDNVLFVTRRALPQTIAGLAAGTRYALNTAMSAPVTVTPPAVSKAGWSRSPTEASLD